MSTDLHTLSGAYAVDALSPEEAEQFRTEIRAWLEKNLPADWSEREMSAEERIRGPAPPPYPI